MLIKIPRGWELPERLASPPEAVFNRRRFLEASGLVLGSALLTGCGDSSSSAGVAESDLPADPSAGLYPVERNKRFIVNRPITKESVAGSYNNFFEFGSHKQIQAAASHLPIRPWELRVEGAVEKPFTIAIDELLAKMPLEERVYRLRCVETWAITVPWSGFPLAELVKLARPLSNAKYLRMETFMNPEVARSQKQSWYPWPYVEALTMAEATNELAFMVTGAYGKPLARHFGAPLRLAVPWKYGFKSIKSITRFVFEEKRPTTFWEAVDAREYGFWANINPKVPHRRWSQASERLLPTGERRDTQLFNGYAAFVADLYPDLTDETYFR
ncbi:MAG: protein-methionine-sulfoxide reductase catalytic subunit MsrP [Hyphomicrobiales bacterium]|nr:MAG: protein-methionine-sulfoxide reductase catalytic subunit MsrP [Hyphomicrobiales bacterium]